MLRRVAFVSTIGLLALGALAPEARAVSCGPAPKAKPHRWTGGESFPPLPLPVTPLRRSEKKRPPAPPALVGKIQYGKVVTGTDEKGGRYTYREWTHAAGDIKGLMRRVNGNLGIRYRGVATDLARFSFSPEELPVLYLSGREAFELDDAVRAKLRVYLQDGGTLVGNASSGSEDFFKSFVVEMNKLFPRRRMLELPSDHPIYTTYFRIKTVEYLVDGKSFRAPPKLWGVNIGCRAAVVFAPYDLACAWDNHFHEKGRRVWSAKRGPEDAYRLGVNTIAYALASYRYGRYMANGKVYFEADAPAGDRLAFGQIVHGGDWDPCPGAAMGLFKYAAANSTLGVQFRREAVDLRTAKAFSHPVLYLTGHHDFVLADEEIANLRRYLAGGGFLLADACCGRREFDAAFRREIARVLPGAKLEKLPAAHPLYAAAGERVASVGYTPAVRATKGEVKTLPLEGLQYKGHLCVVYSPYALGAGWQEEQSPYSLGVAPKDARRLGLAALMYAMTH